MTPDSVVDCLNDLYRHDPTVMHCLVAMRLPCNEVLANHPAVPVMAEAAADFADNHARVGLLGILNALLAADHAIVEAVYDEASQFLQGFQLRRSQAEIA